MFRFNSHRTVDGAAAAVDEEDDRHHHPAAKISSHHHHPATSPRSSNDNKKKGNVMHHPSNSMLISMMIPTAPPPVLTSKPSKRKLTQAALAGLPRFFTKEKARVITTNDIVLRSSKTWNINMPPVKKHMVSGHLVPAIMGSMLTMGRLFVQRDRRITIEIHGPATEASMQAAAAAVAAASFSPTRSSSNQQANLNHNDDDDNDDDDNDIEATAPLKRGMMVELLEGGTPRAEDQLLVLNDNDVVVVRILRTGQGDNNVPDHSHSNVPSNHLNHQHHHHDDDLSTLGQGAPGDEADDCGDGRRHDVECGAYRLEDVVLMKRHGRTCEMKLGAGSNSNSSNTVIRDLKFESEKQAICFEKSLAQIKELDNARLHRKSNVYRSLHSRTSSLSSPPPPLEKMEAGRSGRDAVSSSPLLLGDDDDSMINLLVEIVSATDLPLGGMFSTDAFVKVCMGTTDIHRTKVIRNTRSPIWSLETDSLFLLQITPEQFFASSNGMLFIIKDYDSIGSSAVLGRVVVSHNELLEGTGERLEYEIVPESSTSTVQQSQRKLDQKDTKIQSNNNGHHHRYGKKRPKLYLRFKEASQDDIDFMEEYDRSKGKVGVYAEETYLPPRPPEMKFLKRQTKWSSHHGENNNNSSHEKELLHRVKPYPDPANEEITTWLTRKEIDDQSIAHSTDWLEVGSGDLGRLFVEVIRCDGLPNMDKGTLDLLDKTDAFCCLLFEDGVVNTDVIGDTNSPRWMPWCRRAFSFRIAHPQSDLIIGVFDYDPPNSPIQLATQALGSGSIHDPIGRCVVKLSGLLPQTEYTLTYPLYLGELDEHREKVRGTLTLRIRIQYYDKRKALLAAMKPPPPSHLSCSTQIDYELLDYTSKGVEDANAFSIVTFVRHIKELQGYQKALPYLTDAVETVCLWRGHFQVNVFGKTIYLPLHSMVAFTWACLVCRSFDVIPSLLVFSVGWFFLGTNECRQRNPSPWNRVFSYSQFWSMLVANRNFQERIDPFQNAAKVKAYEEEIKQREQQREKDRKLAIEYEAKLRKVLRDDIEIEAEAKEVDISMRDSGLTDMFTSHINPLKPVLYPLQLQLGNAVLSLRLVKNVILWGEIYFAVWIATFSFLVAAVIFFLPWGFLIGWTIRLCLLLVTGPWMAIADHYYFRKRPDMTDEERKAEIKRRMRLKYESVTRSVTRAASDFQVKKERAIKLRSMKRYLYGQYIVKVPAFNTDKYADAPLPESFAKPVSSKTAPGVNITGRKFGQALKGDMIPIREIHAVDITKTSGDSSNGVTAWSHLKSTIGFAGQQPLKSSIRFGQHVRSQQEQHEQIPLLSTFTRPFQKGYQAVVSPLTTWTTTTRTLEPTTTTTTILEDPKAEESSEHSAGNNNNNNTTTLETTAGQWSTAQNLRSLLYEK